jgi:FkbM family methyltransferase
LKKFKTVRNWLFRLWYGFKGAPLTVNGQIFRFDEELRRWKPDGEVKVLGLLSELLRPGDIMVDVGANFGYHALLGASCVGAAGHVYAFEPVPSNCRLLMRHIGLNNFRDRVTVIPKAASDSEGNIELHGIVDGVSVAAGMHKNTSLGTTIKVSATTLDKSLAHRPKPIRLIKIDVEGAEQLVLRGATTILATDRPLLVVEVHSFALPSFGTSVEAFRRELQSLGYREEVIDAMEGTHGDYYHALFKPVSGDN